LSKQKQKVSTDDAIELLNKRPIFHLKMVYISVPILSGSQRYNKKRLKKLNIGLLPYVL